jgi:hypothetical protein
MIGGITPLRAGLELECPKCHRWHTLVGTNDLTPTTVDAKVLYFECPKSVGKFFGGQVGDVESRYPVREPQKKPTV